MPFFGVVLTQKKNGRIGGGRFTVGFILGSKQPKMGTLGFENNNKKKGVYFGLILGVFGSGGEKIGSLRAKQRPLLGGKRPFLVNGGGKKKSGVFGVKKSGFG